MRKLPFRQADDKDCVPFQPFCLMNGGQCQGFLVLIIDFLISDDTRTDQRKFIEKSFERTVVG